ncbi:MAG: Crp/Fnr family transcriptional regulator [Pararhizobium sp.]
MATLERRDLLSQAEREAIHGLQLRIRDYPPESDIIVERSEPSESCLLVDGLAARAMSLSSGERQIAGVHIVGDFVDLHGLFLRVMDHSIISLTACRVAFVDHAALRDITRTMPHLARMLSMLIAIDAAVQRNWILSLGRRKAESRFAHLVCELFRRLEVVGGVRGNGFDFPISQATLADILGLSIVHTNRTVQHLRSTSLISWRSGRIEVHDWQGLAALADFDPVYLNLFQASR